MDTKSYYDILEVNENADFDEIKSAYRQKIKIWHPDKNRDNLSKAEEMSKIINIAYDVLSDEKKRQEYDKLLKYTKGRSFDEINDDNFSSSMEKGGGFFSSIRNEVLTMYNMFKDCIKGEYELNPVTFFTLGFALLYLIIPTDFIMDFIPFIGYVDDSAVLFMVSSSISNELEEYKKK